MTSEILISLLLIMGTVTVMIGAVGLYRLPDTYTRMHATGMNSTLGVLLIVLAGTIFFTITEGLTLKLFLVVPSLYWTASAGSVMIARAAHRTGTPLARQTIRDDLAEKRGTDDPHF